MTAGAVIDRNRRLSEPSESPAARQSHAAGQKSGRPKTEVKGTSLMDMRQSAQMGAGMDFGTQLTAIKGVGEKTAALFARLHISDVGELLEHYPRGYDFMEPPVFVSGMVPEKICAVRAAVIGNPSVKRVRSLVITTVQAGDATGLFRITFFGLPYLKSVLKPGSVHVFRGFCRAAGEKSRQTASFRMEQPAVYKPEEYAGLAGTFQPRYALTAGLTNRTVAKAVRAALEGMEKEDAFREFLPEEVRSRYGLISWADALRQIHCPNGPGEAAAARRRLAFQEFLAFFLGLQRLKEENRVRKVKEVLHPVPDTDRLLAGLPYRLTGAQARVWKEIERDLCRENAMNRLVQGDVGSGKTILAILALLMCAANGKQGCLMAPTEVLACQHYEMIGKLKEDYGLCVEPLLLTGSMTAKEKREGYRKAASGEANVIIGTHALIQAGVEYKDLALAVTDEQHRFGVRQRETLADKGEGCHVLVMSATPIPRTLAIVLYGDLHVSVVDELPAGRRPIKNCVVGTSFRPKVYSFLKKQVAAGYQAYCICPMVEEGEMEGLENVTDYAAKLRAVLPETIRIGVLHGRMKPGEKNRIMEDFAAGHLDILVSTTVIEVGINVPNATVMMVENAERFGLAQLHQLRGRVGRGDAQSYCIFLASNENEQTMKRLQILNTSNDGFHIANEDLKLRGPGDLFGVRQSGLLDFKIGDIYQDSDVLLAAGALAERIAAEDPGRSDHRYLPLYEWEDSAWGNSIDFRSI